MKIKKGFTLRNIAGCNVVVPVGKTTDEFNGIITLNESAAFFWSLLQKDTTVDKMVKKTLDEYEVDEAQAREDIENLIKTLKYADIIED